MSLSVAGVLGGSARRFPDRIAVVEGASRFTYGELWEAAPRCAAGLREAVFDTLDTPEAQVMSGPDAQAMTGPDAPRELAAAMHAAWVAFATDGDSGWRAWNAERPVMTFGAGRPSLVLAPREGERRAWDA